MTTTAAVVVTYNRKVLLAECLDALLRQSKPLDRIYVVDNASNDGTDRFLQAGGYMGRAELTYIRLDVNMGGAGGFHEGIKAAYADGHDWIWIMDDDAEPKPDALERLAAHYSEDVCAVASLVVRPDGSIDLLHRGRFNAMLGGSLIDRMTPADAEQPSVDIDFCTFVGLDIRRSVVEAIGLPKKEFFIHFDDNEYCHRIRTVGRILLVPGSAILHKNAGSVSARIRFENGKLVTCVPYDKLWLTYFLFRNRTWLRTQKHPGIGPLYAVSALLMKFLGILIFEDHKLRRMRFWLNACMDGIAGRFDNDKPKRLLAE
ncbi:MAG: glycosyltransferase family 2 protein [Rhizomicrobium sp.]